MGNVPTRFGIVFPDDELKERGFPRAVGSDKADLLVVLDLPGEVGKDGFCAQDEGDMVEADGYHGISALYQK